MSRVYIDQEGIRVNYRECFKYDSKLGNQSVDQIANLKLYNFAQQFFNLWETKGESEALMWAAKQISAEEQIEARPYIKMVFEKNGYRLGA